MCRCNNCMRIFSDDSELELLVEDENNMVHSLSEGIEMPNSEIFRGCPECKTDAYLMDLDN